MLLWQSKSSVAAVDIMLLCRSFSHHMAYAKAGNCLFKKYGNWTNAVINAPGCSSVCPEGVNKC